MLRLPVSLFCRRLIFPPLGDDAHSLLYFFAEGSAVPSVVFCDECFQVFASLPAFCISVFPSATRFGISRCWSLRSSACLSGTRRVQLLDSSRACGQGRHSPMACQISMGMQAQGVSVISVAWGSRCGRSTGSAGSFGSELVAGPWVRWSDSVKWSGWSRFFFLVLLQGQRPIHTGCARRLTCFYRVHPLVGVGGSVWGGGGRGKLLSY